MTDAADQYCFDHLRRHDHWRWLTALYAPAQHRAALIALYALDVELGQIPERVSEPMLGELRFAWWREGLTGERFDHPILRALAPALADPIVIATLTAIIDARIEHLYGGALADIAALAGYADATGGAIQRLGLRLLLDHAPDDRANQAVSAAGSAWVCSRTMLALDDPAMVAALGDLAKARLGVARNLARHVPRKGRAAWLPAVLAADDLRRLERVGFDPARLPRHAGLLGRQWKLAVAAFIV